MPDLTITRVFDAPRELVFKAWTDSAQGNDWSAPRGFTVTAFEVDGSCPPTRGRTRTARPGALPS